MHSSGKSAGQVAKDLDLTETALREWVKRADPSSSVVGKAGDAMGERQELCLDALGMALKARRPAPGLIHHTDRGSQYASHEYRRRLAANGLVCSMSRKGDCWDNAVAESFIATLKAELVDRVEFTTRAEAKRAIFEFIAVFYNRERIHSTLDFRSPAEYEEFRGGVLMAS